jgi:hypothetical protein
MAWLSVNALGKLVTATILSLAKVAHSAALDNAITLVAKEARTLVCAGTSGSANRVIHAWGN